MTVQEGELKWPQDPELRFFSYVKHSDSCWEWLGNKNFGYGLFTVGYKTHRAHRWSYEYFVGPIPKDKYVCHHCDNPSCVNPFHLYAGTQKENIRDVIKRKRHTKQKVTHCPSGHRYDAKNTRVCGRGHRHCRKCHRVRSLSRYHKNKLAKHKGSEDSSGD